MAKGCYGRITFEGMVDDDDGGLLLFDGVTTHRFGPRAQQQPGFKLEVVPPPLAVRVRGLLGVARGGADVTRTQLQEMSDQELVDHARGQSRKIFTNGLPLLTEELANRLDDRYPFNSEPQEETP